jgi:hypothetical protein
MLEALAVLRAAHDARHRFVEIDNGRCSLWPARSCCRPCNPDTVLCPRRTRLPLPAINDTSRPDACAKANPRPRRQAVAERLGLLRAPLPSASMPLSACCSMQRARVVPLATDDVAWLGVLPRGSVWCSWASGCAEWPQKRIAPRGSHAPWQLRLLTMAGGRASLQRTPCCRIGSLPPNRPCSCMLLGSSV